ncbi:MAG: hypothetical protein B0D96_07000 [Candidatus Sedimenticola endophacoides]|nr:MAG: hypothetical protein B0D96_07000 [Candidatus Sedimenticola endophacoides]
MLPILRREQITPFVRRLGCRCPAALFERIESGIRRRCGVDCQRILIGGRLLIYVVPAALAGDPVALALRRVCRGRVGADARAHLHLIGG